MTSTSDRSSISADHTLAEVQRADWGRLLSILVARTRRLDLVEDALAEAFARAAERWPRDGVPPRPAAWLYTTAYRLIVGRIRAEAVAGRKAPLLAVRPGWQPPANGDEEWADDRLHLILLCCHPALPPPSRSALALRLVIGTPTEQIARLFLVSTSTMAARLTRAKQKILVAGIPLAAPLGDELRARLDEVCRTVYLAFTAGYSPGAGADLVRSDLADDALRLGVLLRELVPDARQVEALVALLLLQHSRRDARTSDGRLVPLAEQDRSRWHRDEVDTGLALAARLRPSSGYAEELRLQALIAAEHARVPSAADTDWVSIADHYAALESTTGSAIVRLNRAVAVAEAYGPERGLQLLHGLDELLPDDHRLAAVRGELADRAGDRSLARQCLAAAVARCPNDVERDHLRRRLARLETTGPT